jgi:hypothetical protein
MDHKNNFKKQDIDTHITLTQSNAIACFDKCISKNLSGSILGLSIFQESMWQEKNKV